VQKTFLGPLARDVPGVKLSLIIVSIKMSSETRKLYQAVQQQVSRIKMPCMLDFSIILLRACPKNFEGIVWLWEEHFLQQYKWSLMALLLLKSAKFRCSHARVPRCVWQQLLECGL